MPNPSHETKFSGANNADKEIFLFFVQLTILLYWQPYTVDPYYLAICDDHGRTNIITTLLTMYYIVFCF